MKKTITIGFNEQAKAVVAETKIVTETDQPVIIDDLLKESKDLFEKASSYSKAKTMNKV